MLRLASDADFDGAILNGVHLEGADLRWAFGLTLGQLDMASGDDRTLLPERPEGLRPAHWPPAAATPEEPHNAR